jgi:hypothetical protein
MKVRQVFKGYSSAANKVVHLESRYLGKKPYPVSVVLVAGALVVGALVVGALVVGALVVGARTGKLSGVGELTGDSNSFKFTTDVALSSCFEMASTCAKRASCPPFAEAVRKRRNRETARKGRNIALNESYVRCERGFEGK